MIETLLEGCTRRIKTVNPSVSAGKEEEKEAEAEESKMFCWWSSRIRFPSR